MELIVSGGGLKATTRDHGLTEYWANRLTCCESPIHFPRIFCWVYRHEGRRLRHELRCHAVLCSSISVARQIEAALKHSLYLALTEFKRDKISRQNARLSLVNSIYDNPTMPRRKILLSTGSNNYKPPLERSKSAPKLMVIEENLEEEEEIFEGRSRRNFSNILGHCNKNLVYNRRHSVHSNLTCKPNIPRKVSVDPAVNNDNCACDNINENGKEARESFRVKFSDNVTFSDISKNIELDVDAKSNLILETLLNESLNNKIGERNWFSNLRDGKELVSLDSDEGSLSSGCESASTVTSDLEHTHFTTIAEVLEEPPSSANCENVPEPQTVATKKIECDFKLGTFALLNKVRSLEKLKNNNTSLSSSNILIDEVSLIPVGESQSDFSSLKVYKRRCISDSGLNVYSIDSSNQDENYEDEENARDEGYDEVIDCASSVSNIVLV